LDNLFVWKGEDSIMRVKNNEILTTIYAILLCILISTTILVGAEQDAVDENDEVEDKYDYYGDNDDGVAYKSFTVCDDAVIMVQDVQLYCDSPGTFYYGSGKYRNSLNCTAGDKGKFLIDFYISQPDTIQSNGGSAIIDVSAMGSVGWYQQNQEVIENADLCSLSSLKSLSGSVCPSEGKYRIRSNFYWNNNKNDNNNDYSVSTFNPLLSVGFKSSQYQNTFDYGGANTQYCSGNTFVAKWTNNVKKVYANSISNFFKGFGILLFTILIMWAFIWVMIKRPASIEILTNTVATSCGTVGLKLGVVKKEPMMILKENSQEEQTQNINSDQFDFSKMRSPRSNQSFLDF